MNYVLLLWCLLFFHTVSSMQAMRDVKECSLEFIEAVQRRNIGKIGDYNQNEVVCEKHSQCMEQIRQNGYFDGLRVRTWGGGTGYWDWSDFLHPDKYA